MIIRAAICKRLPASVGLFDYSVPQHLQKNMQVGMGIYAPFRTRIACGIVMEVMQKTYQPRIAVKPISDLIYKEPLLTEIQAKSLAWLASASFSSCHTVAHAFLPDKPKKSEWAFSQHIPKKPHTISDSFQVNTFDSAIQLFSSLADHLSSLKNKQVLCLVPDHHSSFFLSLLLKKHSVPSVIIDSALSQGKKFSLWQNARSGVPGIYIGTRSMLLYPFSPAQICILREDDIAYQFVEQHPDIDAVEFARHIAAQHQIPLISFTITPRLDSFKSITTRTRQLRVFEQERDITFHVVSLHTLTPHRKAIIPDDLIEFLKKTDKATFISYNRKGYANQQQCVDCGWQIPCPQCKNGSHIKWTTASTGICIKCSLQINAPRSCQSCGGEIFKAIQPGIAQIASLLKKSLPKKNIQVLQKASTFPHTDPAQIIIGTSFALSQIPWNTIHTVIVLDADMQLSFPDFRVEERFMQRMRWIISRLPNKSHFFIITKQPSRNIFSAISPKTWHLWMRSELRERERFSLPPYSDFVLVRYNASHAAENIEKKIYLIAKRAQQRVTCMQIEDKRHTGLLLRIHHPHLQSFNDLLCKELPECTFSPSPLDLS